jgi:inorganic pyrophosphatase
VEGSSGNLLRLPIGIDVPETINAVIEIPYGGRNKIEYDQQNQIFRLDRVLHSPMYYPGDYGFIPRTLAQDGDPLDVLVLVSEPTFSGCVMSVRPIGYLRLIDEGTPDEKILAVPRAEPDYASVTGVTRSRLTWYVKSNTFSRPINCLKVSTLRARAGEMRLRPNASWNRHRGLRAANCRRVRR